MFLNRSAREALIGIVDWYDNVNSRGTVTIDDLSRLKMWTDLSRQVLDVDKELMQNEREAESRQGSFVFSDDDIPF